MERSLSIEIEGSGRAIPLSNLFPNKAPIDLSKFEIIEKNTPTISPNDYLGFLKIKVGEKIYNELENFWPQSFDQIGELIIIKLEKEVEIFAKEIAQSLLSQNKKATRIFQDLGVQGNFRIRRLNLIGGSEKLGGETKVKENGVEFSVDPTKGYYSPRLATERLETLECAVLL